MVLVVLKYISKSGLVGGNAYADWIVVVFRNPHHLDPNYFHGGIEFLKMLGCAIIAVMGMRLLTSKSTAWFLSVFLAMLILEFGSGLLARKLGLFWFLKTYPFRVADVLVWLFCCLSLPAIAENLISRFCRTIFSTPLNLVFGRGWIVLPLIVAAVCSLLGNAPDGRYSLRAFSQSWIQYARHTDTPYKEMTRWIRSNTPKRATIITGAWHGEFWLEAERAEMVNFKRNPHNALAVEWYRRYLALNGGPFQRVGFKTKKEIAANFPRLSEMQLDEIRKLYGGDYYLTTKSRSDLHAQLVHENGAYYLYAFTDGARSAPP